MLSWLKTPRRPGPPRPTRPQLLAAVPVRNPLARQEPRNDGGAGSRGLRLTAPLRPSRLRETLGSRAAEKSFDLDELGAFVWGALDGTRTVEALIRHFAAEKRVSLRESEVAVLAFLKTLAQRNLVALAVAPAPDA